MPSASGSCCSLGPWAAPCAAGPAGWRVSLAWLLFDFTYYGNTISSPQRPRGGVTSLLLDNMNLTNLRSSVRDARQYSQAQLEASGGLRLDTARAVAGTGVDHIAVGALTHSSRALDLGLDTVIPG